MQKGVAVLKNTARTSLRFKIVDALLIAMMILPLVFGIVLQILTKPVSDQISITGAMVYFTVPMPLQDLPITESQVNSVLVMITVLAVSLFLTHGLKEHIDLKRQHLAEIIVEKADSLVKNNMGPYFMAFSPFIIAIMGLSAFSSLISLIGLYPPTSDINIVGGWAILVFFLITYYKLKCGPIQYLKGFTKPVMILTPINLISEVATPVSMAFRHYGNVLSGAVISTLLAYALGGLSSVVLGSLPGILGDIPLFRIGIPAVLSIYFDVFSGCLQAFIFAMLTMMYVSGGFDLPEYERRRALRLEKKKKKQNKKNITQI